MTPATMQIAAADHTLTVSDISGGIVATLDSDTGQGRVLDPERGLDIALTLADWWAANPAKFPIRLPTLDATLWQKYGHRRLYVKDPDQGDVGSLDLVSGEAQIKQPDLAVSFFVACVTLLYPTPEALQQATGSANSNTQATPPPQTPPPPPRIEQWDDLALNKPGGDLMSISDSVGSSKGKLRRTIEKVADTKTPERSWRKGAEGEIEVARRLAKLPDTFRVLHSIPVGSSGRDIDHLIIGPAGIFCANTKNVSGNVWVGNRAVMVNGKTQNWLTKSRREANDVRKRLRAVDSDSPCPVQPIIVVLSPDLLIKRQPDDVKVVARYTVAQWLVSQPCVLSDYDVIQWYQIARRSTTWPR